ncbi:MAG: aminotransferase class V-fold PLP-dependent enzyme [Spirochaetota bacterium]
MPGLLPDVDPDGLLEFSVVYTDRAVNHMSQKFQRTMQDISRILKSVYHGRSAVIVPGSGTYGMESVARQFAAGKRCLVVRNGLFSFRWSQILETGSITDKITVLKAERRSEVPQSPFAPFPVQQAAQTVRAEKSELVFLPHVETASGMILPDSYISAMAEAVHSVGGLLVLDCVASGAIWVDMEKLGVDILVTAPQKGWSGPPCCAMVLLSDLARTRIDSTTSSSFSCDLKKWLEIMETYEKGGHAYHATPPTDSLVALAKVMREMESFGFDKAKAAQADLGRRARLLLASKGFGSVAAPGFEAPGVVVCYTSDPDIQSGKKFKELGVQIAAGVPLKIDEPADYRSFRLGLFGLDKLKDVEGTLARLEGILDRLAL